MNSQFNNKSYTISIVQNISYIPSLQVQWMAAAERSHWQSSSYHNITDLCKPTIHAPILRQLFHLEVCLQQTVHAKESITGVAQVVVKSTVYNINNKGALYSAHLPHMAGAQGGLQ